MKRILYIATSNIYLKTGGGIANLALLNSLNKDYSESIDVLIYEEFLQGHPKPDNFICVPRVSKYRKLKNLILGRTNRFSPWLENFLKDNAHKYSHCFINSGIMGEYVGILKKYGIKVAVIHHNYEPEFQLDNRRPTTLYGLTDIFVQGSEKQSYEQADLNLFLSEDDRIKFHQVYKKSEKAEESTIGIFEPTALTLPLPIETKLNCSHLAICGSLNSVQTVLGLRNFFKNYLQVLMDYYNCRFKLKLAGRNPNKDIYRLAHEYSQIEIIPNPPIMSEAIQDCGIFICPTNVGGGIKLRIIDGLKLGMPILTHAVSARGYNVLHQYPWFRIYDDQVSFHAGLEAIVKEIKANKKLRSEILAAYNKYFSFDEGDRSFREISRRFLD